MPGRVLNFSEFQTKYSKDLENNSKAVSDFAGAADNFQEGFDKTTYVKDNMGPNKPVSADQVGLPIQPGEPGSPKFNSKPNFPSPDQVTPEVNTPEESEIEEPESQEEIEQHESPEEPEAQEDHEAGESEETEDEEEEKEEEEAEENPEEEKEEKKGKKKEKEEEEVPEPEAVEESLLLESFETFSNKMKADQEKSVVICESCGSIKEMDGETPEEDSWFDEEHGMNCGCNL